MHPRLRLLRATATAAILAPLATIAQAPSTTFKVTTNVQAYCQVTATDLNFGNYSSTTATDTQGQSDLKVTCSPNTPYNVALSEGTSPGATVTARKMTFGANTLNYQLYRTAARNSNEVWGKTAPTDTVQGTGNGTQQTYYVYGLLPKQQNAAPGAYLDTITVTVLF